MYYWLEKCRDFGKIANNLPPEQLLIIEDILEAYNSGVIDFILPDNEYGYHDSEGNKLLVSEGYGMGTGYEISVLKWYEDLEDTEYLVDLFLG